MRKTKVLVIGAFLPSICSNEQFKDELKKCADEIKITGVYIEELSKKEKEPKQNKNPFEKFIKSNRKW